MLETELPECSGISISVGSQPQSAVGDFNADGHPDLAVANSNSNTVSIFLGTGDGSFETYGVAVRGGGPESLCCGRGRLMVMATQIWPWQMKALVL